MLKKRRVKRRQQVCLSVYMTAKANMSLSIIRLINNLKIDFRF